MPAVLEIIPDQDRRTEPLFESEEDFVRFSEAFVSRVSPELEKANEARVKSEQEARERLLC